MEEDCRKAGLGIICLSQNVFECLFLESNDEQVLQSSIRKSHASIDENEVCVGVWLSLWRLISRIAAGAAPGSCSRASTGGSGLCIGLRSQCLLPSHREGSLPLPQQTTLPLHSATGRAACLLESGLKLPARSALKGHSLFSPYVISVCSLLLAGSVLTSSNWKLLLLSSNWNLLHYHQLMLQICDQIYDPSG